jgi:hypothetical protein
MHIAKDASNFYTYSKEFMSGAFPVIDEKANLIKDKLEQESRWKSKKGFDVLDKRENWNELPKKPPQSIIDDLMVPYIE